MKKLLLFVFCFVFCRSMGTETQPKLFGGKYNYISIVVVLGEHSWPIYFNVATLNDTIFANTECVDSFVKSICKGNLYISAAHDEAFELVYKDKKDYKVSKNSIDCIGDFYFDLYDDKKGTKFLTLKTGAKVSYNSASVHCIFTELDKQKYWKISNTSENLQDADSCLVERIAVPVAVAKYNIKNSFVIKPAPEDM